MKRRGYFILGMAILFFIIIISFTACDDIEPKYEYEFKNKSSYTMVVKIWSEYDLSPKNFELTPGANKKVSGNTDYSSISFNFDAHRKDTGYYTGIKFISDSNHSGSFHND